METAFGAAFVTLIFITIYGGLFAVYMIPSIIAFRRNHPNRWLILVINFFLGATGIGWGVALVWALNVYHLPKQFIRGSSKSIGSAPFGYQDQRERVEPSMSGGVTSPESGKSQQDVATEIERLVLLQREGHITADELETLTTAVRKASW